MDERLALGMNQDRSIIEERKENTGKRTYVKIPGNPDCLCVLQLVYYVSFPGILPLEPQRAMIRGLLLLSSSLRQALPARSLMTDSSLKMRAC